MTKETIKKLFHNFLTAGSNITHEQAVKRSDNTSDELRNLMLINSLGGITIIISIPFIFGNILADDTLQAMIVTAFLFSIVIYLLLIRFTHNIRLSNILLHIIFAVLLQYSLLNPKYYMETLLGFFTFTVVSFILLGRKKALLWSALVILSASALVKFYIQDKYYQDEIISESISILTIYLFLLVSLFINHRIMSANENLLVQSRQELVQSVNQMVSEIDRRRKVEEQLQSVLKNLSSNNNKLEDTQRAMLNLMEDLESEKAKIQKKNAADEAILLSIGDGLIVNDKEDNIILINNAFENILGYNSNDVIGKKFSNVLKFYTLDGIQVDPKELSVWQTLNSNQSYLNLQRLIEAKDGRKIPISINMTPINLDGQLTGAVEVFRDITKDLEVDRAKTEFVSLASHQLKTPLSSINWYTELLSNGDSGELNDEQKDLVKEIAAGSHRMTDLVNALLNVSRINMGTFAVDPEIISLEEIAESVISELKHEIQVKNLNVTLESINEIPKINADPRLTRIVFQNLISNSVKYTPAKGSVKITLEKKDKDILIKVKDSGYGIPENQKEKIFTKLFRADNVLTKETDGTGLGLYIVKSIIEISEGNIWFDSVENKGSTFYVSIPLKGMKKREGTKQLT